MHVIQRKCSFDSSQSGKLKIYGSGSGTVSTSSCLFRMDTNGETDRASDISRKKEQNFAGFSGANSRKNRPISRDFRGKKVKKLFAEQSADFRRFSREKSQNSQKNRPISRDFSGKESIFEGFSGANNFLRIS